MRFTALDTATRVADHILVDGIKADYCFEVDTDEGWADCYAFFLNDSARPRLVLRPFLDGTPSFEPVKYRLYGKVEVVWRDG